MLDEYAQMPPRMFAEVLRPALTDRRGWAIFIGTPAGRNAFCELYEQAVLDDEWYAALFKASETGVLDEDELKQSRRHMSADQYNQEFECSFEAAIPGAYYGVLMREALDAGRVGNVAHQTETGVETWWDLGIGDPTAIWAVQRVGNEFHCINYYQNHGEGIAHYAKKLAEWREQFGYNYINHVLPHDAMQKSLQTADTLAGTLGGLIGPEPKVMERRSIEDGIERVRNVLTRTWFDKEKCAEGIECLRQYRQHWDDKRQAYTNKPYHDWTSHGADSFKTGCMFSPDEGWGDWGGLTSEQLAPNLAIV